MGGQKKDGGEFRRKNAEDDAYDDLLNSLFGPEEPRYSAGNRSSKIENIDEPSSEKKPSVREKASYEDPKKAASSRKSGFKLDIKDLDSEFYGNEQRKTEHKNQGVPREQLYKKASYQRAKNASDAPSSERGEKPERSKSDLADTIDLLPEFSYEKSAEESHASGSPVYYKPIFEQKSAKPPENPPVRSKKERKQDAVRRREKQNGAENGIQYRRAAEKEYEGAAVIIKKNELPEGKRVLNFFRQNKSAWIIIAVCIAAAVLISTYAISCMNDILAINRDSDTVITVNLPADADTKTAIDLLKDNGLIKHKMFCRAFSRFMNYRDDNYLTGIYYLTESMGLENMLSSFKKATVSDETVTLTFPEGYSVDQIAEKLEKYEVCKASEFYATLKDVDFSSEYSFIAEEDNKELRYRVLEGYLYPDTYEFYIGENAASVIRKFLDNFNEKWTDEYSAQAQKLGMSIDDVITLASIIEKEAYGADQMPLVSSVLHNRINKSGLYPTLQCDSTTAYINDYISKNVTDSSALSKYTQNYSTYKCEGLPVGAICNPGDDAINGALYPSETNYYFFLHDNNKKLYLAENDAQHRENGIAALKANQKNG